MTPPVCSPTQTTETTCNDGVDNDCDGRIDTNDTDCQTRSCLAKGASCTSNSQCCSNNCGGKKNAKTCK